MKTDMGAKLQHTNGGAGLKEPPSRSDLKVIPGFAGGELDKPLSPNSELLASMRHAFRELKSDVRDVFEVGQEDDRIKPVHQGEEVVDTERERQRLKLPKDATSHDIAREKTLRNSTDYVISYMKDQLGKMMKYGLKSITTPLPLIHKNGHLEFEAPEWVKCRYKPAPDQVAKWEAFFPSTLVGSLTAGATWFMNSFPMQLGVGLTTMYLCYVGLRYFFANTIINTAKPTISPAVNDLLTFCKDNGVGVVAERSTDGRRIFKFMV